LKYPFLVYFILLCGSFSQIIFPAQDIVSPQTDTLTSGDRLDDIENFLSLEDETGDDNEILDIIESLSANPLQLNSVTLNQLLELPFFDLNSANQIIEYRNKNGRFFSLSELRMVPGLDPVFIDRISRIFVIIPRIDKPKNQTKLKKSPNLNSPLFHLRSRVLTKPDLLSGQNSDLSVNSKSYSRIIVKTNSLELSGLLEKDFAEKNYLDFLSGGISLTRLSPFSNVIVGDFIINHGHSLLLSSPFPVRKSSSLFAMHKSSSASPKLYRSSSESKFLRGIVLSFPLGFSVSQLRFSSLTLFASLNSFDASLDSAGSAVSLDFIGLHSTQYSISKKRNFNELLAGSSLSLSISDKFRFSILSALSSFDKTLSLPESPPIPRSAVISSNSLAYDFQIQNFNLSGELAFSFSRNSAIPKESPFSQIHSVFFNPSKGISIQGSVRNYSPGFISLHSAPFAESSSFPYSESGIYAALLVSSPFGRFSLFFDQFLLRGDLNGYDTFFEFSTKLSPKILTLFRIRYKSKESITSGLDRDIITRTKKLTLRSEFSYHILPPLRLRSRADFSLSLDPASQQNSRSAGYLFCQDFTYNRPDFISIAAGFLFFDTDDFSSALYEFEYDLPGLLTIKPLYGEGFRYYLLANFTLFEKLLLTFKYSETYKSPSQNSNALDRSSSEFNLQVDLKF